MNDLLSITEAATKLGINPARISQALWEGKLGGPLCPRIAGRRLIRAAYLPEIAQVLKLNKNNSVPVEEGNAANEAATV